jgi:hypothetical protein
MSWLASLFFSIVLNSDAVFEHRTSNTEHRMLNELHNRRCRHKFDVRPIIPFFSFPCIVLTLPDKSAWQEDLVGQKKVDTL